MFTFLLVVHAIIAAALVTVILMQRSEGGGLGMGSGPSGLMTARGAADFLTRATSVLATLFVLMAFALAAYASLANGGGKIDTSLAHQAAPGDIKAPVAPGPLPGIPMMGTTTGPIAPDPATAQALAPASAGLPTRAQPTPQPVPRRVPDVSRLKTIDTKPTTSTNFGINGVNPQPATSAHIGTPAIAAPAATPPAEPTKPAAAAGGTASSAGNSSQPQ